MSESATEMFCLSSIHSATAIVNTVSSVTEDCLFRVSNLIVLTGFPSCVDPAMSPITVPIIPLIMFRFN